MPLVVLVKGANVGGQKRFRPTLLAQQLRRFDIVNIGAAGTFVVRKSVGRRELRAAITSRLPFEADVVICSGSEILTREGCGHAPDDARLEHHLGDRATSGSIEPQPPVP